MTGTSSSPKTMRAGLAVLWLCTACTTLYACAGASTGVLPRDARAAGGSPTYRPVPLRELAYGRPQPGVNGGASAQPAALTAYLLPTPSDRVSSPPAPPRPARVVPRPVSKTAPTVASRPVEPASAQPAAAVAGVQLASVETPPTQRYAEREARAQSQQQYRGGDVLVITASTLVIVLLIVLIVVLLLR
ncbi:MAG TPA: hypothetical protein VL176_12725 [Steroidobacteraceae bacterium]|nr:hypothetical protein [Steroidobacteraceae bacterium]